MGCPARCVASMTTLRQQIVALAGRPDGVNGMGLQTILGIPRNGVHSHMIELERQCRIVRAEGTGQRIHWFASPVRRDAWIVSHRPGPETAASYTAGPSNFAAPGGTPIVTPNTTTTVAPCPDVCARWQAQPSQPAPGFVAMGIGRYL